MTITQRQVVAACLAVSIIGAAVIAILLFLNQRWTFGVIVGALFLCYTALFVAYRRGWRYTPYLLTIIVSLATASVPPLVDTEGVVGIPVTMIFPVGLAAAIVRPPWVVASAILTLTIYAIRVLTAGLTLNHFEVITYVMSASIMFVACIVLDTMARQADEARQRAETSQTKAEEQARALEVASVAQQAQIEEQRRLLDLVATLEVPAITLADGILFTPIVGHLDSRRSTSLTARLLEEVHRQRTHHVIIDISGVPTVDTVVAQTLIGAASALRLLGCRVTLSGISPDVALTLTLQNIQLSGIDTVSSPQEAMRLTRLNGAANE